VGTRTTASYVGYLAERDTLARSAKTALLVGTILALLNHYQAILAWVVPTHEALQIGLTYLVPFSVASFGQIAAKRQRDLGAARACRCPDCPVHASATTAG